MFFLALTCLAVATLGSVAVYQRGERLRLQAGGAGPRALPTGETSAEAERRRRTSNPPDPADVDEPTLSTLSPGDVVSDDVDDWVIVGSVRYREESDTWALHVLDGGRARRLLEVRQRQGMVDVALVEAVDDLPRGQLFSGLTYRGQSFALDGRGDARTATEGDVDASTSRGGSLQWARYAAAGGAVLLIEDEGPVRRVFFGAHVPPATLTLWSGTLNRSAAGEDGHADDPR
jgi:hypothetical protein